MSTLSMEPYLTVAACLEVAAIVDFYILSKMTFYRHTLIQITFKYFPLATNP
jgi:hypothetical protein